MSLFIPALTRATDENGHPASGATWSFYRTGTLEPVSAYADSALETELGPVVTANSSGKFVPIYLDDSETVRAVLEEEDGSPIDDIDPYNSAAASQGAVLDITDFGIVAGDDDALATANSAAVEELLAYLLDNIPNPTLNGTAGIKIAVPAGQFRFAEPWVVKQALFIEGQSNSQRYAYATWFDFDKGGFEFHATNTDHDGEVSPPTTGAAGYHVEGIFCSSRAATETGHHGLHAVVRGDIVRCTFTVFPGDGIRIESQAGFGVSNTNANSTRILYCQAGGNGGAGIRLLNGDANCAVTEGCDVYANGEWGIDDNAFLSNVHIGHHAEGNGLGVIYDGHKFTSVSSMCYYPFTAYATGVAIAVSAAGTYRVNASKLYLLLLAGGGNTANAPTHTTVDGVTEADGYRWAYAGTTLTRRYYVAFGQAVAASTTAPGTNSAVWIPYTFAGSGAGIPLWATGMTWKEGGSYRGNSTAGETVWTGCYSEEGQAPAQIRSPQVWIGGQSAPSPWSTATEVRSQNGALRNPLGFHAEKPFYNGIALTAQFGADLTNGKWLALGHSSRHPNAFYGTVDTDVTFQLDAVGTFMTFTGPNTTFTGGRSTAQPGKVVLSELFLGVGTGARCIDEGTAAPSSGERKRGDIRFNTDPSASGKVGWVCTTSGSPGTWKPFGAIDA